MYFFNLLSDKNLYAQKACCVNSKHWYFLYFKKILQPKYLHRLFLAPWYCWIVYLHINGRHIFSDMQRDCICDLFPPGPFLIIRDTLWKWLPNVGWVLGVCGLPPSCASCREQHFYHSAACLCLRCLNRLVVLPPLVATAFKLILQHVVTCSESEVAKLNQFQVTEDMETSSSC